MQGQHRLPSSPKDQWSTCFAHPISVFHDVEKSKHWAVDAVVIDRLPETPGQEPNVARGTKAKQCDRDRSAPACPEFPSVSSFDLHPSEASIPDFTEDVAEESRITSLLRVINDIHSAKDTRSSDDSDGGSFLLDPVRKIHPTRCLSLPSPAVTVRVAKMRSFYSPETSTESPIEYDYFQVPAAEERGMRAAFNHEACVMEGIDKVRSRNRASTRILLSSDVNSSCGKAIEQVVIAVDRPRAAYNAVLGSRINLQIALRKLQAMQEIQFSTSKNMGQPK
jgi:hypothetical protein